LAAGRQKAMDEQHDGTVARVLAPGGQGNFHKSDTVCCNLCSILVQHFLEAC
jgi:hypothetical protein